MFGPFWIHIYHNHNLPHPEPTKNEMTEIGIWANSTKSIYGLVTKFFPLFGMFRHQRIRESHWYHCSRLRNAIEARSTCKIKTFHN